MLKRKLTRITNTTTIMDERKPGKRTAEDEVALAIKRTAEEEVASPFFVSPIWKRFYDLECALNVQLSKLKPPRPITHTYNPVEYAAAIHCAYMQQFLDGTKRVLFVGMNPGPNGMGQTGVPFGNITAVRDLMGLSGDVSQPPLLHDKRPVTGMSCKVDEPSGVRLWGLLQRLAGGTLNTLFKQCFVHNFCPLAFFDCNGRNITPSELKGAYKSEIRDLCLKTLDDLIDLVQPEIFIAIGEYVFTSMQKSRHVNTMRVLKLPHPSPRSLNNHNWPEKAERIIVDEWGLLPYIQNTKPSPTQ